MGRSGGAGAGVAQVGSEVVLSSFTLLILGGQSSSAGHRGYP